MIDFCPTPESYAKKLAGYIKNPSTIRVRTLEYFGRAPSLERCQLMIAAKQTVPEWQRDDFVPVSLAKWSCNHEVNADNAYLKDDGEYGCLICRRVATAEKTRREKEKRAQQAAKSERLEAARAELLKAAQSRRVVKLNKREGETELRAAYAARVMYDCLNAICVAGHFDPAKIIAQIRRSDLVVGRAALYRLAREYNLSTTEIGRHAKRDHSSVINLLNNDPQAFEAHPGMFERVIAGARAILAEDVAA